MNKQTPRDMMIAALLVIIVLFAALIFGSMVIMAVNAKAHDEPPLGSTNDNPDSIRVTLEFDPDGDGVFQVRHVFNDRVGIWDRSSQGLMRITTEIEHTYQVGPDTVHQETGTFWRDLFDSPHDSVGVSGLAEFSAFGRAYAQPMTILPTGSKMWDAIDINPDTGDTTVTGTFYLQPVREGEPPE